MLPDLTIAGRAEREADLKLDAACGEPRQQKTRDVRKGHQKKSKRCNLKDDQTIPKLLIETPVLQEDHFCVTPSVLGGIIPSQAAHDDLEIGLRLRDRNRRLQAPHHGDGMEAPVLHGTLGYQRHPDDAVAGWESKRGRKNAHDLCGLSVHEYGLLKDLGIGIESGFPEILANERYGACTIFRFSRFKQSARNWLDSQGGKVSGSRVAAADIQCFGVSAENKSRRSKAARGFENMTAVLQIQKVGPGRWCLEAVRCFENRYQPIGLGEW